MHIYFSGIGGSGIGPLALMAKQAGYTVSGSDKQKSAYTDALGQNGINLHIGQNESQIAAVHAKNPIDWLVYSSAVKLENPDNHPELKFAQDYGIKCTKRDELLNKIITDHDLKLIAIAGTHGKTTTTAMVIWLCQQIGLNISYLVGAKLGFGPMGQFQPQSKYLVYECDEFDRNFLAFHPYLGIITGVSWDHHEVFKTQQDYDQAFIDFISQNQNIIIWQDDFAQLRLKSDEKTHVIDKNDSSISKIELFGAFNRQDAWQAVLAVQKITDQPIDVLVNHVNSFPGLKQRMEQLAPNLYSNYAHTPEKIRGGMLTALEIAKAKQQEVVVIYEPLTNRRQHHIKDDYKDCFDGAKKIYWVPTYLAREDPNLPILTPAQLIPYLSNAQIAEPAEMNDKLLNDIRTHLAQGDMVVAIGASGAGSLDEWLRSNLEDIKK